jgi:hypothetical protein
MWKLEAAGDTKRFGYRSLSTLKAKIPEPDPVLPGFLFNPQTFGISP